MGACRRHKSLSLLALHEWSVGNQLHRRVVSCFYMLPVAASHHHRLSQNVPVYIIGLYSAPKNFNTEIKNFYKPTRGFAIAVLPCK